MTKALSKCVQANFDDYWRLDPDTGCWNWTGAVSKGYGRLKVDGRGAKAYRVAFERANGPLPAGAHVLHSCDNKLCVNPGHLRIGTHLENMRDRMRTYRVPSGEKAPNAKLSQSQVDEVRKRAASGELQREIGRDLGVSGATVSDIVRGVSWKESLPC